MKLQKRGLLSALMLSALGVCGLLLGCTDDDPCDSGQIEKNSQCYPPPASAGKTGSAGGESGGAGGAGGEPDAAAGAPSGALDTPFGTACQDNKASSDCGGVAPVCADLTKLGQTMMCTQLNCAAGEANAGACPEGFTCFAFPGYPSVCTKE